MRENSIMIAVAGLVVMFGLGAADHSLYERPVSEEKGSEAVKETRERASLAMQLEKVQRQLDEALDVLDDVFGHPVTPEKLRSVPVTITAYSSTVDQCDSSPHIAANNEPVRVGALAVSRDLLEDFGIEYGQRVLIPGYGVFEVCDTMHPRWERRVDIWESDRQAALLFGKRRGKLIWLPLEEQKELIRIARNDRQASAKGE